MALTPDFPKSPFEILDPSLRWFPADESLRESSAEKLMPPLVSAIRIKVHEFRAANYAGASKTSKSLLNWWFKTPHPIVGSNPEEYFNYFFSQREAIEAIIYLHDVEQVVNQNELLEFDGHGLLRPESFAENWRRYVLKLATGAGKTKVLSLALTWSYFHKMYEEDSDMARNFLIIAPNIIVLDRLRVDFEGLKIFKDDPLIPEDGFEGQDWNSDFKVDLFVQDETNVKSHIGNIFLTNIQRVYDRQEKGYSADDDNSEDYFLGSIASSNAAGKNYDLSSIVADVDELVVLNDEAHHIHDEGLAWYRSIEHLHLNLLQKNSRLSMQIDVTATPKHQNGAIFAQTICDYPLVEAIAQNVVKTPVLPDILSRSRLKEINSSKFSQRYADYLRLGVEEWRKSFNIHWKMNKKSVLFIMTDDTKNCDDVAEWLEENYPTEFDGKVLTIHTKKNGEISESTSGKGKEELESLRKQAREIDRIDNPFRAIVSVLMLKEGWDVRNVTTIVGLRPFTASANILPEQALGRGLRRMYTRDADVQEYVSVVGTEAFMDFVESIKSEGVTLEHKPMNKDSDATGPRVVEIDQENLKKDMDSLDIQIPVLSPKLKKEYKRLEELDLKSLDFKPLIMKKFSEEQLREIVFGEIVEGKEHHRTLLKSDAPADWRFVIKFFTERILKELRLFKGYDTLYPLVKEFCAEMIFGKSVNLEEEIVLKNLSEIEARRTIEETFKKAINSLTIHESGETEVRDTISVRKTRPFVINDSEFYRPNKSVFNIISGDSILELRFAALLDNCADVVSFGKNYFAVNFKLDYLNADGVISYYYPDFLVKLKSSQGKESLYVVETKGREDLDDPLKFSRLEQWIKDVNSIPGAQQIWNALYVSQETFDKNRDDYRSFADLVAEFKDSRPKTTKSA
jgi:type III restriction enzyme